MMAAVCRCFLCCDTSTTRSLQSDSADMISLDCTRWAKKAGPQTQICHCQILIDFRSVYTGWFLSTLVVKLILKIPTHLAHVVALPCETLVSAKQAINDKLQGSVATYLRYGGVANKQIKNGLLVSVWVKKIFNRWTFGKVIGSGCLMHFVCLANTLLQAKESTWDNHV